MTAAKLLAAASDLLQCAEVRVLPRDPCQAERLHVLVRVLDHEAEYAANVGRGYDVVTLRRGPAGRTLGWYVRHDPHTRAVRRALGLWLPEA